LVLKYRAPTTKAVGYIDNTKLEPTALVVGARKKKSSEQEKRSRRSKKKEVVGARKKMFKTWISF